MRRDSERLNRHAQSLVDTLDDLAAAAGLNRPAPPTPCSRTLDTLLSSVRALRGTADDLNEAGSALQRYATELAEGHELARRAQRRVKDAGLRLEGTRVLEPWGVASDEVAQRRRAEVPHVQARVDLATAHVGRARARLAREMVRLTASLPTHAQEAHAARPRRSPFRGPDQHRLGP